MYDVALVGAGLGAAFLMFLFYRELPEENRHLKFLYFTLSLLFLVFTFYQAALLGYATPERLGVTEEQSFYYNCSRLTENCTGTPASESCTAYNEVQCKAIDNCTWFVDQDEYCIGTPTVSCEWLGAYDSTGYKCAETIGCSWDVNVTSGLCDEINVTYHYTDNYTSAYQKYGESASVVGILFILLIVFVLFMVFLGWFLYAFKNFGKDPRDKLEQGEDGGNPYVKPL